MWDAFHCKKKTRKKSVQNCHLFCRNNIQFNTEVFFEKWFFLSFICHDRHVSISRSLCRQKTHTICEPPKLPLYKSNTSYNFANFIAYSWQTSQTYQHLMNSTQYISLSKDSLSLIKVSNFQLTVYRSWSYFPLISVVNND